MENIDFEYFCNRASFMGNSVGPEKRGEAFFYQAEEAILPLPYSVCPSTFSLSFAFGKTYKMVWHRQGF